MVAQRHKDKLEELKEMVVESTVYNENNSKRFHRLRSFLFRSNLSTDDKQKLASISNPTIEFNTLESYISRLRGEFSKQVPSIYVSAQPGANPAPELIDTLQGHIKYIIKNANKRQFELDTYTDGLSGGFGVFKLWLEYESNKSFNQVLKIGKGFDPTLFGFDPLAREPDKGDGAYSFEKFPKTVEDLEREYPDAVLDELDFSSGDNEFPWAYKAGDKKIVLLNDFYEKKKKRKKILKLSNGTVTNSDEYELFLSEWQKLGTLQQPPMVVDDRYIEDTVICNYVFIGNEVLDYKETIFTYLPHIFYCGNGVYLREGDGQGEIKQFTKPYFYNAIGVQKLKNLAGQKIANEIENFSPSKFMADKRSIPIQYLDQWLEPQKAKTLIYDAFTKDGTPLPPPTSVLHPPIPQEIFGTFTSADQTIQSILGAYDPTVGVNRAQLSGTAIVEGATQTNSAAMPFVTNYMAALNQAALFMIDVIPKIYNTPRTIPVIDSQGKHTYRQINTGSQNMFNYDPSDLNVSVESGVNYEVQKNRNIQLLATLGQAFPAIGQFVNDAALPYIFDNLDIEGAKELKDVAMQWMKAQKQNAAQNAQNNPQMIALNLKKQELMQNAQAQQSNVQLKQAELAMNAEKIQTDKFEAMIKFFSEHQDNLVQMIKANTEQKTKAMEFAMKKVDQDHQHAKDIIDTIQAISQKVEKTGGNESDSAD